ncbi:hypothetical protein GOBAR_AA10361 [Gossypium barbadense]|uniref:CCHC-type domain-containing protein n=1 Tax=Gossypium barbadense TaxID=3634 RepID=A0A2P5Y3U1_GOSBA|nr:hypothetical protein GOBAR_AA10361 [Gossypium barbadense]
MEMQNSGNGADRNLCDDVEDDFQRQTLGGRCGLLDGNLEGSLGRNECELEIFNGDVNTSIVNGIPVVAFLDRIKDLLFKEMERMIILKLLERNIGYNDTNDYNKVLTQGPWIIFEQYLTIQLWTRSFDPAQPYPNVVMAWIRLPGLLGYLYKKKLLKPLEVLAGGAIQQIEYEALSTVCFSCGKYGHFKYLCPSIGVSATLEKPATKAVEAFGEDIGEHDDGKNVDYGLWMLVERKSMRGGGVDEAVGDLLREKKDIYAAIDGIQKENRVLSLKDLGHLARIGHGAEVNFSDLDRPILGPGLNGPKSGGSIQNKGDSGFKALRKRPVGDGFLQKEKDLEDAEQASGPSHVWLGGPSVERIEQNELLVSYGLTHSGLDSSSLNDQNIILNKQHLNDISSNDLFQQEIRDVHSISSGNIDNKLVLNNPMFEGSNEFVVNLGTNFLDPKRTFENKVGSNRGGTFLNLSFKEKEEAISSMVNLVNSQAETEMDGIRGSAEGQTGGSRSTSA